MHDFVVTTTEGSIPSVTSSFHSKQVLLSTVRFLADGPDPPAIPRQSAIWMLLALHVYEDARNSECHYHKCKGERIGVHDVPFRACL